MLRSEYDREQSQIYIADDLDQSITLSSEQALFLFRWLSQLFSRCQGCDRQVSPDRLQALTYMRQVAPFRVQTAFLCSPCYAGMFTTSVETRSEE